MRGPSRRLLSLVTRFWAGRREEATGPVRPLTVACSWRNGAIDRPCEAGALAQRFFPRNPFQVRATIDKPAEPMGLVWLEVLDISFGRPRLRAPDLGLEQLLEAVRESSIWPAVCRHCLLVPTALWCDLGLYLATDRIVSIVGPEDMRVDYMARALELASRARGRTSPNPMVGAVLVKDGRIVGEGFHRRAGGPHAERWALREAGNEARGARLYINLEPCCHHGRTPPCTDALVEAEVAEVHMAMEDPNPLVHGKGRKALHMAGIRTYVGEHQDEARQLNEVFIKYITSRQPFVTAKFAMSLDGKIATVAGESRWISGEQARRRVHELRDTSDAICVGVNTLLSDDPRLTTRLDRSDVRHPLRVVLDSRGRSPLTSRAFDASLPGGAAVATTEAMPASHRTRLRDRGVEVWVLPSDDEGHVSLTDLLNCLGSRELISLLVEGGGSVLASFVERRLVDKVLVFVAPMIIGGQSAPTPVRGVGALHLADALRLKRVSVEQVGEDVLLVAYPNASMPMSDS